MMGWKPSFKGLGMFEEMFICCHGITTIQVYIFMLAYDASV